MSKQFILSYVIDGGFECDTTYNICVSANEDKCKELKNSLEKKVDEYFIKVKVLNDKKIQYSKKIGRATLNSSESKTFTDLHEKDLKETFGSYFDIFDNISLSDFGKISFEINSINFI